MTKTQKDTYDNQLTADLVRGTLVPTAERLAALPKYFGKHYLIFENHVYLYMRQFVEEYNGGYWDYYELSNGGFYMSPTFKDGCDVVNRWNYFSGHLSADATGIGVCLMVMSSLSFEFQDAPFADRFFQLRAFALKQKEADKIMSMID